MAVKSLQDLVGQEFPAGVDGNNAITSLKGIIEDSELFQAIKEVAKTDPDKGIQPLIKVWLEQNAPEVVGELDFAEMSQESSHDDDADDADEELPFDVDDEAPSDKDQFGNTIKNKAQYLARKGMRQAMDVKEVAAFINSFYDRDSGTFPKGPEGVATMVGKKFGEQAETVARKFVERMAPQQATDQNPELQELSRIRELAGNDRPVEAASMPGDQYLSIPADQNKLSLGQQMARDGITYSGDNEQEMIGQIVKYMKDRGDSPRTIRYRINDDDFVADTLSDLRSASSQQPEYKSKMQDKFGGSADDLTKGLKIRDDINPELEAIKKLSGIGQGMGF